MGRTLSKRGNGEGTIYYSETTKKWIGQITLGRNAEGKQIRKSFYGNTRKEVKEKMDNLQKEMQEGKNVSNTLSIVDIAEEIRNLKYNSNSIKRASYIRIGETIDIMAKLLPFANIPIQNVIIGIISAIICYFTGIEPNLLQAIVLCIVATMGAGGIADLINIKNKEE